ncbi:MULTISPECIES: 50S ribosomal protein L9 [unclassified Butyrivibrio]|uniref:50S ribosomal protein L9 n=1 Tax=unclassified Butyrivibrio TaxID=2639466 RepID=UPI0004297C91|nr:MULTISPECIES: 50S ribosomal protein L9 [unclassified Butyrivibrio]SDB36306.1 large subunit ribosomal protein L9 [Butyrivibrio sp. INlla16]SEM58028.1 large subunit ribosomal protein L9 [Butyrivibrio sp. ob235]
MEVILLEDVKSLGKKGDVVKVSDGYASNFILPKKLGVEATKANLTNLKNHKAKDARDAQALLEKMQEYAKEIEKATVHLTMKAGEGGRVFGSVSSKEIATEAKKQCGFDIDKKKIQLSEPIRNFGTTEVPVKLHPQVTATLRVSVTEA